MPTIIQLTDEDTFGLTRYDLVVYLNGTTTKKGILELGTNFQYRSLLRELVIGWTDDVPADWSAVDLTGLAPS